MLLTKNKTFRRVHGFLETFNLLFFRLLLNNRSKFSAFPGEIFRAYMSLVEKDKWLCKDILDVFPDTDNPLVCLRPRADRGKRRDVQDAKVSKLFVWDYLKIVAEYLMDSIDSQHVVQDEWDRTIIIHTFDIGGFNFNLKPEDIESLMQHGYNAVIISDILPYINS